MKGYSESAFCQEQLIYDAVLKRVSSISMFEDREVRKQCLWKAARELSAITEAENMTENIVLYAKAFSLKGMAEIEMARLEENPMKKETLLKSGVAFVAKANHQLSLCFPDTVVSLLPDNLAALTAAFEFDTPQVREDLVSAYAAGFEYYIKAMAQLLFLREKGVLALFKAELLLRADEKIESKDGRMKIIAQSLKLVDQAMDYFALISDQEALEKVISVREKLEGRLNQLSVNENPEIISLS